MIVFLLGFASCAPLVPTEGTERDLYSDAQSARATADAALQQAQFQERFLTASAEAPIVHITETAAAQNIADTQTPAALALQKEFWTATAQQAGTNTALPMTQTAQAWTPTPDATQTSVFAKLDAENQAIANNAERDNLELQRQQANNAFWAAMGQMAPLLALVLLAGGILLLYMWISRRERYRPIPVDERGNPLAMLDVVEGTATDVDRNPNYRSDLRDNLVKEWLRKRFNLPSLLPAITAARQDAVTERDQMVDLGTRGLPGATATQNAAAKKLAGQEMLKQISATNLQSRFRILDDDQSNIVNGEVLQVLDQEWEEAKKRGDK